MEKTNLLSILHYGYPPISAFEFDVLRTDKDVQLALQKSVLYIIAKRPLIQFTNLQLNNEEQSMSFYLSQNDNSQKLDCKFYVNSFPDFCNRKLKILAGSFSSDPKKIHGIKIYDADTNEFLHWFNAEKFLYSVSHGNFKADINGNILDFLTFDVLYVGKCTDENIYKRFKSHHALQEILIKENIITKDYQNSHELVILPFEFYDNSFIKFYNSSNIHEMLSDQQAIAQITSKTIALDEEKALIKCLNPKYNSIKYKSYPKSSDGLYNMNIGVITYSFAETLRLRYSNGAIIGNVDLHDKSVSCICIQNGIAEIYENIN